MRHITFPKSGALVIAAALATTPAFADKPAWAGGGGGKGEKHERKEQSEHHPESKERDRDERPPYDRDAPRISERGYFDDRHRTLIHDYYAEQFRAGHCPPGLAKKHNGCLPPGQAKKWAMGRPLPHDVVYYDLPSSIARQIGMPPAGYRYVRVANDILLIATGTRMVMDAIMDLGGGM